MKMMTRKSSSTSRSGYVSCNVSCMIGRLILAHRAWSPSPSLAQNATWSLTANPSVAAKTAGVSSMWKASNTASSCTLEISSQGACFRLFRFRAHVLTYILLHPGHTCKIWSRRLLKSTTKHSVRNNFLPLKKVWLSAPQPTNKRRRYSPWVDVSLRASYVVKHIPDDCVQYNKYTQSEALLVDRLFFIHVGFWGYSTSYFILGRVIRILLCYDTLFFNFMPYLRRKRSGWNMRHWWCHVGLVGNTASASE